MAPSVNDIERSAEIQRAELAERLDELRNSVGLRSVKSALLDEGRTQASRVGMSFVAALGRHPIPVVAVGLILAFAYRQHRLQANGRGSAGLGASEAEAEPRLLTKMRDTAEEVFSQWAQAVSASLERAAVDATRHLSESLVRAADAMIATALERFARSLSEPEN
jgi:hypothetical protein